MIFEGNMAKLKRSMNSVQFRIVIRQAGAQKGRFECQVMRSGKIVFWTEGYTDKREVLKRINNLTEAIRDGRFYVSDRTRDQPPGLRNPARGEKDKHT